MQMRVCTEELFYLLLHRVAPFMWPVYITTVNPPFEELLDGRVLVPCIGGFPALRRRAEEQKPRNSANLL